MDKTFPNRKVTCIKRKIAFIKQKYFMRRKMTSRKRKVMSIKVMQAFTTTEKDITFRNVRLQHYYIIPSLICTVPRKFEDEVENNAAHLHGFYIL